MFIPGLVSVSFRPKSPEEVITLVREGGLEAIEWGGDKHVPHGDIETARAVGEATRAAGLRVACYGSYYRCGLSEDEGLAFTDVLETAAALGAPSIRVWAGKGDSEKYSPEERARAEKDSLRVAALATEKGIAVASEYHSQSLTDTPESAERYLEAVRDPNFFSLWQPTAFQDKEWCLRSLRGILPRLLHLHCFHWKGGWKDRLPLADGTERWADYLAVAHAARTADTYILIEFVKDDTEEQFLEDAATLREWVEPYRRM